MPWKEAGLTEKQAAAHLLNRFAFGPRPGEVDAVVKMGLDRWLERQLAANLPDGKVQEDLRALPALGMSTAQIFKTYPPVGLVLPQAKQAGVIPDDVRKGDLKKKEDETQRSALKEKVTAFAAKQGYRPQKELLGQLMTQKLVRAVESENQLAEVMTDFWFNHFNVSLTDNKARPFLLSYERDAIRPHALGRFRDLLEATAKSPAMLRLPRQRPSPTAARRTQPTMADETDRRAGGLAGAARKRRRAARRQRELRPRADGAPHPRRRRRLHPEDVVEVARAFTGWTILPVQPKAREAAETRLARAERAGGLGFHQEGDFLFRADRHDAGRQDHARHPSPRRPRHRGRRGRARPAGRSPRRPPGTSPPSSPCASSPITRRRRWSTG